MDVTFLLPFIIQIGFAFIVAIIIVVSEKLKWPYVLLALLGVVGIIILGVIATAKGNKKKSKMNNDFQITIKNASFKSNDHKRKWKCPSCESINEEGSRFCPNCGRPYSEDYLLEDWICPKCKNKNPHDAYHCTNCDHERDV